MSPRGKYELLPTSEAPVAVARTGLRSMSVEITPPLPPISRWNYYICRSYLIRKRHIFLILFFIVIIFRLLLSRWSYGACMLLTEPALHDAVDEGIPVKAKNFNVILLGDSLVTEELFPSLVNGYLPNYKLKISASGSPGNRIHDIKARLSDVLKQKPNGVILFWDSDCSDVDEWALKQSRINSLREGYRLNVTAVASAILKSGASVAIAGPALIGERPVNHKDKMLEDYREINRKVADTLNIPFIDTRAALKDVIPSYRLANDGCVTTDGENLNTRGVAIVSYMFAQVIYYWVQNKEKGTKL